MWLSADLQRSQREGLLEGWRGRLFARAVVEPTLLCRLQQAAGRIVTSLHACCPFFCSAGGGSGGQVAKDALGNDIKASSWLATHQAGDRSLSQGLKVRVGLHWGAE